MADKLVIVESPTKAKTISRYLGKGYAIKASGGHVRDLPADRFGVDVEDGFRPTYELLPRKQRTIGGLKKASAGAEVVYLAPDPDREGEAIAWHLQQALALEDEKVRRVVFHEITRDAVRRAFEEPRALDMDLVDAQQARRILDRIVGYELSPLISRKIVRGLSAGRVQSVALRLICERELEVRAFQPEEYWEITARLSHDGGAEFEAELREWDGEEVKVPSESAATELVEKLRGESYTVRSVEKKRTTSRAPAPFITSTLQQAGSSQLGLTTAQTMRIAQQLYEGVEIAGQSEGLITYMRTDSTRVAAQALGAVRRLVQSEYGEKYLPAKANVFRSPKAAQAAHEAVRPTDVARAPQSIKQYLSDRQFRLYDLIWRRFVASQMTPALYEATKVGIRAGAGLFVAGGRQTLFDGYTRLTPPKEDSDKPPLPPLAEGDLLELHELVPSQHFTQPPPRYTEASLVRELERRGIGRPSTYAPIISTLLKRNYVRRRRRTLVPSELGLVVTEKLVAHFPREMDYDFTGELEEKLDKIESGKAAWRETLREFFTEFQRDLERARKEMKAVKDEDVEQEQQTCEKCDRKMVVRFSRKGDRFLGCSGFPECDHTVFPESDDRDVQETEHKCPKCGAPMLRRTGRRGRPYLACSAYPKCRQIMGLDKEGNPVTLEERQSTGLTCRRCGGRLYFREGDEGGEFKCDRCARADPLKSLEDALTETEQPGGENAEPCPKCGSPMAARRGKKGYFLGCSRYPDCKEARSLSPDELPGPVPTLERCEKCNRPFLLRWGRYGRFLACSGFPSCRNTWRIPASMPPCPRPDCGGRLLPKVSAQGEKLYGCTRFPSCDYTAAKPPGKKKKTRRRS